MKKTSYASVLGLMIAAIILQYTGIFERLSHENPVELAFAFIIVIFIHNLA